MMAPGCSSKGRRAAPAAACSKKRAIRRIGDFHCNGNTLATDAGEIDFSGALLTVRIIFGE
jgi:hypothetical protein